MMLYKYIYMSCMAFSLCWRCDNVVFTDSNQVVYISNLENNTLYPYMMLKNIRNGYAYVVSFRDSVYVDSFKLQYRNINLDLLNLYFCDYDKSFYSLVNDTLIEFNNKLEASKTKIGYNLSNWYASSLVKQSDTIYIGLLQRPTSPDYVDNPHHFRLLRVTKSKTIEIDVPKQMIGIRSVHESYIAGDFRNISMNGLGYTSDFAIFRFNTSIRLELTNKLYNRNLFVHAYLKDGVILSKFNDSTQKQDELAFYNYSGVLNSVYHFKDADIAMFRLYSIDSNTVNILALKGTTLYMYTFHIANFELTMKSCVKVYADYDKFIKHYINGRIEFNNP